MQEHECYTSNVSSPAVSRIRALSACHRLSHLNSLFCSVLRASSAPSSSPPPLTVSHRCSRVVQEAVESSRMLQLTPCSTSRWPLGTKSLAGTVLLPPTRALSPWLAIAARQGVGSVCSRAVHGLAAFDTDTCSGWERRRCEWLCAASSTRQERPCFARSTTHARSLRSPAAAARRPTRGFARARSGPCATATPAVSTHASCHRHHRCQSAAPLPLLRLVLIPARTRLVQSRGMAMPQGTQKYSDGTYTGEWCGGKRHGQGVMAFTSAEHSGDRCVRHAGGCAGG